MGKACLKKMMTMRNLFTLLIFSLPLLMIQSCTDCVKGTGNLKEETRTLKEFDEIEIECSADVILKPIEGTDPLKAVISAQENLLPFIKTTVNGTKLTIDIEGCISTTEKMEVLVDSRNLKTVLNDGSGDVSVEGTLKAEVLTLKNDGSGDIELEADAKEFFIGNSGSGDLTVRGNAVECEIKNNGSGDIDGFGLKCNEVIVSNSGSGDVELYVRKKLKARLNGSGNITYEGNPQSIDQKTNGSGEVMRRN
jgi:hypothetical protein